MYACPEWFRMRWSKVNWIFSCFCRFSLERQSWDQLLLRYQEEAEEILSRLDLWQEIGRLYLVTFDLISVLLAQTEWWIQSYRPVNSSNLCRVHMNSVTENGEWGGWEGRVVSIFSQRTELPLFCAPWLLLYILGETDLSLPCAWPPGPGPGTVSEDFSEHMAFELPLWERTTARALMETQGWKRWWKWVYRRAKIFGSWRHNKMRKC